ncbi:hypothetical protein [Flavobacterium subsaxonicum]|uniref:Histidine kinase n=1 Tax=Flavobacterium subsaxonicum WB 4.1-42 = DSM 21790 TaxID=1121898 RepID=A0A0A2MM09_9FLAO|nr:hypothetical protein [Flavobacterium subsaxonicum]KGO92528.1 hypothetical protein Q766_12155 [Flavobacterium subsaxonicum WB 4.1-42 = DSM 21790]
MKNFIILLLKFIIPPVLLVAGTYAWLDPFKVLWYYDSYYISGSQTGIPLNKEYVSTTNFENRYAKQQYNSFIFGSSRSMVYSIAQWQEHLPANAKPYHFDASGESLFALHKKLVYLDNKGVKLNNALVIIDHSLLVDIKPATGPLFVNAPQLLDNANILEFHYTYLKAFLSAKFILPYLDYKLSGTVKPYMKRSFFVTPINYNPITNEVQNTYAHSEIKNGTFYTPERMALFYKRDTAQYYYKSSLKQAHRLMLQEIAAILKKHNTNYKIVISPLYNQKKLAVADVNYLKQLFGNENIYDFSGINSITNDYTNYYETSHYRPQVARSIVDSIYKF